MTHDDRPRYPRSETLTPPTETSEAPENGPDEHSCLSNDNPIQPGADLQCDVVYDIPTPAFDRARAHGLGLIVVNFGDDLSPNSISTPREAGLIVLDPLGSA